MVNAVQHIVNAQVDINRAEFAFNDSRNKRKLQMKDAELKEYMIKCAASAVIELNKFLKANK